MTGADKRDALARTLAGDESVPLALLGDGLDEIACDEAARPRAPERARAQRIASWFASAAISSMPPSTTYDAPVV